MGRTARLHDRRLLLAGLIVAVAAAALGIWLMTRPPRITPPEPPNVRMSRQIRTILGPDAELRYSEPGQRRAVCGYVGRDRGGPAVGFVSTPNRILFSDDPLPTEFRELRRRYCPGFMQAAPQSLAMR